MDCKEVLNNVDKYFEGRLCDLEIHTIKKHLERCEECKSEYNNMEVIFNLLSNHAVVSPPLDFTEMVMNKISNEVRKSKLNSMSTKRWGKSFVAAGLLIAVLNFTSIGYSVENFAGNVYKESIEFNNKVFEPFEKIHKIIENFTKNINIKLNDN